MYLPIISPEFKFRTVENHTNMAKKASNKKNQKKTNKQTKNPGTSSNFKSQHMTNVFKDQIYRLPIMLITTSVDR